MEIKEIVRHFFRLYGWISNEQLAQLQTSYEITIVQDNDNLIIRFQAPSLVEFELIALLFRQIAADEVNARQLRLIFDLCEPLKLAELLLVTELFADLFLQPLLQQHIDQCDFLFEEQHLILQVTNAEVLKIFAPQKTALLNFYRAFMPKLQTLAINVVVFQSLISPVVPVTELKKSYKYKTLTNTKIFTFVGEIFQVRENRYQKNNFELMFKNPTVYIGLEYLHVRSKDESLLAKIKGLSKRTNCRIEINNYVPDQLQNANLVALEILPATMVAINSKPFTNYVCHTKFSTMDGLCNVEDYFVHLQKIGQQTLALVDFNSVQAYPSAFLKHQEYGINLIYGVELEAFVTPIECVQNADARLVLSTNYVVFDIETTGLHPITDVLIEIAAIKYNAFHQIVDQFNVLVKVDFPLSEFTKSLTHITDEMLETTGINQTTALMQFLDFIADEVLVAHNGINFDVAFLNSKLRTLGMKLISNLVVDTLLISRAFFSDVMSHSLGALAKRLGVNYDEQLAHRALEDSNVLQLVYKSLLDLLVIKEKITSTTNWITFNQVLNTKSALKFNSGDRIYVYAKNNAGIRAIYQLVSVAHTINYATKPLIFFTDLLPFRQDLMIANNPLHNRILHAALNTDRAQLMSLMAHYDVIFIAPNSCYQHLIHRQVLSVAKITQANRLIIEVAQQLGKKVLASAIVKYISPDDSKYYAVLVHTKQIHNKPHWMYSFKESNEVLAQLHYRNGTEIVQEFAYLEQPELIQMICYTNQAWLNAQFDYTITPLKRTLHPPIIEGNTQAEFVMKVNERFVELYGHHPPSEFQVRLDYELENIIKHQYVIIYWISHLLVQKSIADGYLVGSRGSVGSSFVAFLLKITEINPLEPHYRCLHCCYTEISALAECGFDLPPRCCPRCNHLLYNDGHNIPFATFMGFNADKIPDIDLNFSGEYQANAHHFLRELFGDKHCFRAGTISTVAEKTAYGMVKNYFENQTVKPLENNSLIADYVQMLTEVKRTTGQHPGGIIVVPKNLDIFDFSPYNFPADDDHADWFTTHFAFEFLHDSLLKFDILGHDDPTVLKMLFDLTGLDPLTIPNQDAKVLRLFSDITVLGITPSKHFKEPTGAIGIPEFGTAFVRQIIEVAQPQSFADLVRISGLSHGTDVWKNNAENLIIKENLSLKELICCRDDILIFLRNQGIEDLTAFKIAEDVRKGKKLKPEYETLMREHHIPEWYLGSCNKIAYLFPKAHASAYVLMAWRIAYYKLYYPLAYYASYLSVRCESFDLVTTLQGLEAVQLKLETIKKLLNNPRTKKEVKKKEHDLIIYYEIIIEMLLRKFKMYNIDLYKSHAKNFVVLEDGLLPPFIVVDGLGINAANSIVEARIGRVFASKKELLKATKLNQTNVKILEDLRVFSFLEDDKKNSLKERSKPPKNEQKTLFDI